jgi:hypothetical protein
MQQNHSVPPAQSYSTRQPVWSGRPTLTDQNMSEMVDVELTTMKVHGVKRKIYLVGGRSEEPSTVEVKTELEVKQKVQYVRQFPSTVAKRKLAELRAKLKLTKSYAYFYKAVSDFQYLNFRDDYIQKLIDHEEQQVYRFYDSPTEVSHEYIQSRKIVCKIRKRVSYLNKRAGKIEAKYGVRRHFRYQATKAGIKRVDVKEKTKKININLEAKTEQNFLQKACAKIVNPLEDQMLLITNTDFMMKAAAILMVAMAASYKGKIRYNFENIKFDVTLEGKELMKSCLMTVGVAPYSEEVLKRLFGHTTKVSMAFGVFEATLKGGVMAHMAPFFIALHTLLGRMPLDKAILIHMFINACMFSFAAIMEHTYTSEQSSLLMRTMATVLNGVVIDIIALVPEEEIDAWIHEFLGKLTVPSQIFEYVSSMIDTFLGKDKPSHHATATVVGLDMLRDQMAAEKALAEPTASILTADWGNLFKDFSLTSLIISLLGKVMNIPKEAQTVMAMYFKSIPAKFSSVDGILEVKKFMISLVATWQSGDWSKIGDEMSDDFLSYLNQMNAVTMCKSYDDIEMWYRRKHKIEDSLLSGMTVLEAFASEIHECRNLLKIYRLKLRLDNITVVKYTGFLDATENIVMQIRRCQRRKPVTFTFLIHGENGCGKSALQSVLAARAQKILYGYTVKNIDGIFWLIPEGNNFDDGNNTSKTIYGVDDAGQIQFAKGQSPRWAQILAGGTGTTVMIGLNARLEEKGDPLLCLIMALNSNFINGRLDAYMLDPGAIARRFHCCLHVNKDDMTYQFYELDPTDTRKFRPGSVTRKMSFEEMILEWDKRVREFKILNDAYNRSAQYFGMVCPHDSVPPICPHCLAMMPDDVNIIRGIKKPVISAAVLEDPGIKKVQIPLGEVVVKGTPELIDPTAIIEEVPEDDKVLVPLGQVRIKKPPKPSIPKPMVTTEEGAVASPFYAPDMGLGGPPPLEVIPSKELPPALSTSVKPASLLHLGPFRDALVEETIVAILTYIYFWNLIPITALRVVLEGGYFYSTIVLILIGMMHWNNPLLAFGIHYCYNRCVDYKLAIDDLHKDAETLCSKWTYTALVSTKGPWLGSMQYFSYHNSKDVFLGALLFKLALANGFNTELMKTQLRQEITVKESLVVEKTKLWWHKSKLELARIISGRSYLMDVVNVPDELSIVYKTIGVGVMSVVIFSMMKFFSTATTTPGASIISSVFPLARSKEEVKERTFEIDDTIKKMMTEGTLEPAEQVEYARLPTTNKPRVDGKNIILESSTKAVKRTTRIMEIQFIKKCPEGFSSHTARTAVTYCNNFVAFNKHAFGNEFADKLVADISCLTLSFARAFKDIETTPSMNGNINQSESYTVDFDQLIQSPDSDIIYWPHNIRGWVGRVQYNHLPSKGNTYLMCAPIGRSGQEHLLEDYEMKVLKSEGENLHDEFYLRANEISTRPGRSAAPVWWRRTVGNSYELVLVGIVRGSKTDEKVVAVVPLFRMDDKPLVYEAYIEPHIEYHEGDRGIYEELQSRGLSPGILLGYADDKWRRKGRDKAKQLFEETKYRAIFHELPKYSLMSWEDTVKTEDDKEYWVSAIFKKMHSIASAMPRPIPQNFTYLGNLRMKAKMQCCFHSLPTEPYSLFEAINGNEYLNHMKAESSAGVRFQSRKIKEFIKPGTWFPTAEPTDEFVELVKDYLARLDAGLTPVPVSRITVKQELRTQEKYDVGKLRGFDGGDLIDYAVGRMHYGPIFVWFVKNRHTLPPKVGTNMTDRREVNWFCGKLKKYPYLLPTDHVDFDNNQNQNYEAASILSDLAIIGYKSPIVVKRCVRYASTGCIAVRIAYSQCILTSHTTMSGKYLTEIVNSLQEWNYHESTFLQCLLRARFFEQHKYSHSLETLELDDNDDDDFGDDNIAKFSKKVGPYIHPGEWQMIMRQQGMVVTDEDDKSLPPQFKQWDQVTFLKRKFRYSEEHGCHVSMLDLNSIKRMLSYYPLDSTMTKEQHLATVEHDALRYLSFHPKLVFDEVVTRMGITVNREALIQEYIRTQSSGESFIHFE